MKTKEQIIKICYDLAESPRAFTMPRLHEDKFPILADRIISMSAEERPKGYTELVTVPYQKCPVCEGAGQIYIDQLDPHNTSIAIGYRTCHVCGGSGIIPMHVLSYEPQS